MCGEVADGLHVHPLNTRRYVDEVHPSERRRGRGSAPGATRARSQIACPVFTIVGDTDEEQEQWRQEARFQIAFYGSTRTYRDDLRAARLGRHAERACTSSRRKGDFAAMAATITDEMLDEFAITSTWDGLADAIRARYDGVADQVIAYFSLRGWAGDPAAARTLVRGRAARSTPSSSFAVARWRSLLPLTQPTAKRPAPAHRDEPVDRVLRSASTSTRRPRSRAVLRRDRTDRDDEWLRIGHLARRGRRSS